MNATDRDAWLQTYGHCFCCCCGGKRGNSGGSGRHRGGMGSGCDGGGDESPVSRFGRSSNFGHGTTLLSDIGGGPTPRTSSENIRLVTRLPDGKI